MTDLNSDGIWYCGDNFENDIVGGTNVNMQTIFYKGKKEMCVDEYSNVICIDDWNEVITLLDTLG